MEPVLYDAISEKQCGVRTPAILTIYVCGVTVYDHCHVGHGRIKVVFDVWRRWLASLGQSIFYVSNITDIDDKIIAKAIGLGESWENVANRYIQSMHEDDAALGIMPPDREPRATEFLAEMIELISLLMDQGKAYVSEHGDVCLSVGHVPQYGQLSKQNIAQLREKAEGSELQGKRDSVDFVLWKHAKPGEPSWESPWGLGRPGWHLECSAMAKSCLGHPIDWHGGGVDLKFPHHENECAQSEAAYGAPFSRHWMHVGLINRDGVKMSKSLGNTVVLKQALSQYGPNVLRLFYLKTHYRKPLSWTDASLSEASARWERYARVCQLSCAEIEVLDQMLWADWLDAMADDFNTPLAMSHMDAWAKKAGQSPESSKRYGTLLYHALKLWGCQFEPSLSDDAWIVQKVELREAARSQGNYQFSDEIRDELLTQGIILEDSPGGVRWYRKESL